MSDWVMFYDGGRVVVDVVLREGVDERYPREGYVVTPHHGRVGADLIIERRARITEATP